MGITTLTSSQPTATPNGQNARPRSHQPSSSGPPTATAQPRASGWSSSREGKAGIEGAMVVVAAHTTQAGPRARPPSQSNTRRGALVSGPRAAPR